MKKTLLLIAAFVAVFSIAACNKQEKEEDETKKAEITVAKDNLVTWFDFEGSAADKLGKLTVNKATHQFTATRNGKALKGVEGGYLLYDVPADSKLLTMKAFTVSMWLKQAPIPTTQPPVPCFFEFVVPDAFWGSFAMSIDRLGNEDTPSDILTLKIYSKLADEKDFWFTDGAGDCGIAGNRWNHLIYTYDGAGKFHVYLNGTDVTPEGKDVINPANAVDFSATKQLIIGGWQNKVIGGANDEWMGDFLGEMDEFRIYDIALSADQAKALYQAEAANID